jgi:hypothetical protein
MDGASKKHGIFIYFVAAFIFQTLLERFLFFVGLTMDDDAKERSKFLCGLLLTYSLF